MIKWDLDRQAAAVCSEFGDWKQVVVFQFEIDETASRHNAARRENFDAQLAEEYAAAMREGATFPCIVCVRIDGAGKFVIAGGNHRHAAARKLKESEFPAIVMNLSRADFALLAKRLNVTNGKRETTAARAEAAADLVRLGGRTCKDAAKAMGISVQSVYAVIAKRELEETSLKLGHGGLRTPPTVAEAARPMFLDADLAPACLQYLALNPTAKETNELTAAVKKAKSLHDRQAVIAAAIESRRADAKITGGAKKPIKAALIRGVRLVANILEGGDSLCYLQMTTEEAKTCQTQLESAAQKLRGILAGDEQDT